jgi:hypothetical protein
MVSIQSSQSPSHLDRSNERTKPRTQKTIVAPQTPDKTSHDHKVSSENWSWSENRRCNSTKKCSVSIILSWSGMNALNHKSIAVQDILRGPITTRPPKHLNCYSQKHCWKHEPCSMPAGADEMASYYKHVQKCGGRRKQRQIPT